MLTKPSSTAVITWMTMNTTAIRDRFRCRLVTANRGRPGSRPCRLMSMPSTITAVSRTRATTPVARLVYQGRVLLVIPFIGPSLAGPARPNLDASSELLLSAQLSDQRASGASGGGLARARAGRRRRRRAAETATGIGATGVVRVAGAGAGTGAAGAAGAGPRGAGTRIGRRSAAGGAGQH